MVSGGFLYVGNSGGTAFGSAYESAGDFQYGGDEAEQHLGGSRLGADDGGCCIAIPGHPAAWIMCQTNSHRFAPSALENSESISVRFLSAHTLRVSSHPRFAGSWRSACKRRTAIKRFLSASNCRKLRDRNAEEGMYDQYDVSVRFVWEAVRLDHASDL